MELGFTLTLTMNVICDILVQGKSVTVGWRFVDARVQNAILLSLLAAPTLNFSVPKRRALEMVNECLS